MMNVRKFTLLASLTIVGLCGPVLAETAETAFITLGTNSGPIPNSKRSEPANLLRAGGQNILIDVGDAAAWQLSKAGVSLREINNVLLSHLHFDHTGGLFAFISQRYQMIEASPVTIYGPPGTKALVDSITTGIAAATRGGNNMRGFLQGGPADNINVTEIADGAQFTIGDVRLTAARNSHYVATLGGDDPQAVSLAFRFDMPARSIVYTGDTGPSEAVEKLAKGVDLLICEIMDPEIALKRVGANRPGVPKQVTEMIGAHFRREHVSPTEAGLMATRAGAKKLVLTHNALPDEAIGDAGKAISQNYKGPFVFANDLDSF